MYKYIISLLVLSLFVVLTLVNLLPNEVVAINLIFMDTPALPGVVWLYFGVILGSFITIPIMLHQAKKSRATIINQHVKQESKRIKKMRKRPEKASVHKTTPDNNINPNQDIDNKK